MRGRETVRSLVEKMRTGREGAFLWALLSTLSLLEKALETVPEKVQVINNNLLTCLFVSRGCCYQTPLAYAPF